MFQRLQSDFENVIGFKIGESITAEDVHEMGKITAEAIAVLGEIRLLIEIEGFRHMEPEALLEKLKFARDYATAVVKMAVVSVRTWIKSWLKVGGLFTHREVEHFHRAEMEDAWKWLGR